MNDIRIKQLALENFKCHEKLTLDLFGGNASVYGDNATGKTSIYDALTWLLFGKDSAGNGEKNIEIKPLRPDGEVRDHNALTCVEAVLLVNGEEVTLRRTYKEVWSTKRGAAEATYDGNTSEYYLDGVPCKRNAFQEKVNALVDEDTFRMLTSVSHFANGISWQDRRAVLFQVAGVMDDAQILASSDEFAPLLEAIGKRSLDDYKKLLQAEKRKFVGAKTDIPARISECQKTIADVQDLDFAAAKQEVAALQVQKDAISAQIVALDHENGAQEKSMEIRQLQLDLSILESANNIFRERQMTGMANIPSMNIRLTALRVQVEQKQKAVQKEQAALLEYESRIDSSRKAWKSVNDEIFSGGICMTCGQALPEERLQQAVTAFETQRQSKLRDIVESADYYKQAKAGCEERQATLEAEIRQLEDEITNVQKEITAAEQACVEPVDMDDYAQRKAELEKQLDVLNDQLVQINTNTASVKMRLRQEMTALQTRIDSCMEIISKENLLSYSRNRIMQLQEDAKNASECLEAVERMLYLLERFSRYKTRFVEDSINGLFRLARFRLFREQANGGIEERCDVVHEGVPYISVNNGMKINLGIDIINTLSRTYGVRVPLFVDNAESVTNLETCDSQVIRLVVSENDKELRVNYES